jgi:glycosyltransferase involved in cell wall biosynthesis
MVRDNLLGGKSSVYSKATVINNGVDCALPMPDQESIRLLRQRYGISAPLVIGSVGRLAREKAYARLIQSFAALKRPDVALLLVGDGAEGPTLRRQSEELGLAEKVHFVGWQADVRPLLAVMDVFALPSNFEAMPFSILEAMSMRKPVVASDVGGVREMVIEGKTGYIVPPGDIARLTDRLRLLIESPDLRGELGSAGRVLVMESFSEESMIRRTVDIYESLIRRKEKGV